MCSALSRLWASGGIRAGTVCLGCPASAFCGFSHLVRASLSVFTSTQVFHSNPSGQPGFAAAASLMRIKEVGDVADWALGDGGLWKSCHSDPFLFQGPRPPFFLYPCFRKLVMLTPNACTARQHLGWSVPCILGHVVV